MSEYKVEKATIFKAGTDGFTEGYRLVDENGKNYGNFSLESAAVRHKEFREHCDKPLA